MSHECAILMSTPMVQGSLADLKTETRRLRGLEKLNLDPSRYFRPVHIGQHMGQRMYRISQSGQYPHTIVRCPYGDVGTTLWVRETWMPLTVGYGYLADGLIRTGKNPQTGQYYVPRLKWRPSIHMPRKACRLLLDLQTIRLERLHDITELGAVNEGVEQVVINPNSPTQCLVLYKNYGSLGGTFALARNSYITLWDKLNATGKKKMPFSMNPWVWVLGYRRLIKIEPHET